MTRWLPLLLIWPAAAADLPGSQDPPLMKRYAGSEIIGYRSPKFDEFVLPLGKPTQLDPPAYVKSQKVDGLLSRYTYVAPEGRTPGCSGSCATRSRPRRARTPRTPRHDAPGETACLCRCQCRSPRAVVGHDPGGQWGVEKDHVSWFE